MPPARHPGGSGRVRPIRVGLLVAILTSRRRKGWLDIGINRTSGQAVRCATEGLMKPDPNQGIDIVANTRVAALAPPTIKLSVEPGTSTELWACLWETFRFADTILFPFPENLYQLFTDRTVLMLCQDFDVLIYASRDRN